MAEKEINSKQLSEEELHEIEENCCEKHTDTIEEVMGKIPCENMLYDLSDFFKVFSDSTRIKILFALDYSDMCVCDIAEVCGMTKSAVSHQLKTLRQERLVRFRKSGKNIIYSLADSHVKDILEKGLEHINER